MQLVLHWTNLYLQEINNETNIVWKTSMEGRVCTSFEYVLSVISLCNKRDLLTTQDFFTWHTAKFYSHSYSVQQMSAIPVQALRVSGGWGSQISWQSAHEDGKVVSPMHQPPLPPQEIFLTLISVRSWIYPTAIMQLEELSQWKISMTPLGIKPLTFRL